jgi:C-terminal processing protease CtpA/Prc
MKRILAIVVGLGLFATGATYAQQDSSEGEKLDAAYNTIMRTIADHYVEDAGATLNPLNQPSSGPILNRYELRTAVQNALSSMRDRRFSVLSQNDLDGLHAYNLAGNIGLGADLNSVELIGDQGIKVTSVNAGSFALAAGINREDRILVIDDRPVSGMRSSEVATLLTAPGAPSVKLVVIKYDRIVRVTVPRHPDGGIGLAYVAVQAVTLPKVGDVDPRGPAAEAGLRTGDIITSVDGIPARTIPLGSLNGYITSGPYGSSFDLNIIRFGVPMQVHVQRRVIEGTLPLITYAKKVGATQAELTDPRLSNAVIAFKDFDWSSKRLLDGLDNFLADVQHLPGVILDLQGAGGSNTDTAALVLARFSAPGDFLRVVEGFGPHRLDYVYSLSADRSLTKIVVKSGAAWYGQTLASRVPHYSGKVVAVINSNTWGGGAAVAQALQESSRGQVVGRSTNADGTVLGIITTEVAGTVISVRGPTAKFVTLNGGKFVGVVPDMESSSQASSAFEVLDPFPPSWTWTGLGKGVLVGAIVVGSFIGMVVLIRRRRKALR